jgi:GAF domain-containing protein
MLTKEKKISKYDRIYRQLAELLAQSPTFDAQLATTNAILYHKIPYFFWVGFYFLKEKTLTVGPYQGPLACQKLEYAKGVCWKSVLDRTSIIVKNVHEFPGHIACDSRSKSEIVIPIVNAKKEVIGVLDVDSNKAEAFDEIDEKGLKRIIALLKC